MKEFLKEMLNVSEAVAEDMLAARAEMSQLQKKYVIVVGFDESPLAKAVVDHEPSEAEVEAFKTLVFRSSDYRTLVTPEECHAYVSEIYAL